MKERSRDKRRAAIYRQRQREDRREMMEPFKKKMEPVNVCHASNVPRETLTLPIVRKPSLFTRVLMFFGIKKRG
jgi:hypothetical protein